MRNRWVRNTKLKTKSTSDESWTNERTLNEVYMGICRRAGSEALPLSDEEASPDTDDASRFWTKEEDEALLEASQLVGLQWRKVAERLSARTDSSVRNRYRRLVGNRPCKQHGHRGSLSRQVGASAMVQVGASLPHQAPTLVAEVPPMVGAPVDTVGVPAAPAPTVVGMPIDEAPPVVGMPIDEAPPTVANPIEENHLLHVNPNAITLAVCPATKPDALELASVKAESDAPGLASVEAISALPSAMIVKMEMCTQERQLWRPSVLLPPTAVLQPMIPPNPPTQMWQQHGGTPLSRELLCHSAPWWPQHPPPSPPFSPPPNQQITACALGPLGLSSYTYAQIILVPIVVTIPMTLISDLVSIPLFRMAAVIELVSAFLSLMMSHHRWETVCCLPLLLVHLYGAANAVTRPPSELVTSISFAEEHLLPMILSAIGFGYRLGSHASRKGLQLSFPAYIVLRVFIMVAHFTRTGDGRFVTVPACFDIFFFSSSAVAQRARKLCSAVPTTHNRLKAATGAARVACSLDGYPQI